MSDLNSQISPRATFSDVFVLCMRLLSATSDVYHEVSNASYCCFHHDGVRLS